MADLNDNERRGMPADIDLLIRAAKQVVNGHDNDCGKFDMTLRINNLNKLVTRVDEQYQKLINK